MDNEQPFDSGKLHALLESAGVQNFEGCNSRGVVFFTASATEADRLLAEQVMTDYANLVQTDTSEVTTIKSQGLEVISDVLVRIEYLEKITKEFFQNRKE